MCPPAEYAYDESCESCRCNPSTHLGTRIGDPCLGAAPNCVWASRDPASKEAHWYHLTGTRERRALSWRQHQSGKLHSIEFKGLVRQPPHVVAKGTRTDIWRADYVEQSLTVRPIPRRCDCV